MCSFSAPKRPAPPPPPPPPPPEESKESKEGRERRLRGRIRGMGYGPSSNLGGDDTTILGG